MIDFNTMASKFYTHGLSMVNKPLFLAIRRGVTYMIPILLLSSVSLVALSLPIPAYQKMMLVLFGDRWSALPLLMRNATYNITALLTVLCVSYSYALEAGRKQDYVATPIITCVVSLCSFMTLSGVDAGSISADGLGVSGIFAGIVTAVLSSALFIRLSATRLFHVKAFPDSGNASFNYVILMIYPALLTITTFAVIHSIIISWFGVDNIQEYFSERMISLFRNISSPIAGGIVFVLMVHSFWFFGMHGTNVLEHAAQQVFGSLLESNRLALLAGGQPEAIFTKTFFDTFVFMGGTGAVLCLLLAIFLSETYRKRLRVAKMSLLPALFNINELVLFGIPVVLNPIYLIPFILVPVLITVVSALATYWGLVPYTVNFVEWTTPIFLSGYLSTGSIRGSLLQLFNLLLGVLCYFPFVRISARFSEMLTKNNLETVYSLFKDGMEKGMIVPLLIRQDDVGSIARFLLFDLESDVSKGNVTLFYQPQVDYEGRVIGAEALLRWKHANYGYIYPPLAIALAEESGFIHQLGFWILDKACADIKRMYSMGIEDITVSVNVSATQLENDAFIEKLTAIMRRHQIQRDSLQIEITEQVALMSSEKIISKIMQFKKLGVKLAMDDFGMGHSSLTYLKEHKFDTIKCDGMLVRDILTNKNCSDIISSIVFLGKSLDYTVLAECVETADQKKVLHDLGCDRYQGYLFSPAVAFDDAIRFILKQNESLLRAGKEEDPAVR